MNEINNRETPATEGVSRFNRSLGLEIYGEKLCRCFHEILELIWGR